MKKRDREILVESVAHILVMRHKEEIRSVAWQGGESTLHSKLLDIIKLHKKYNIQSTIFTNGMINSPAICEIIRYLSPAKMGVVKNAKCLLMYYEAAPATKRPIIKIDLEE